MGNVSSRPDDGSALYLRDQDRRMSDNADLFLYSFAVAYCR